MKYEAGVHEDLMKSPQQLGADGNDGPREAEAMGGHAGGPGARGLWILDSMRIAQRNEGRLPRPSEIYPKAERHAFKRAVLCFPILGHAPGMGHAPGIPGCTGASVLDPALRAAQCSHAVWSVRVAPPWAPARTGGGAGGMHGGNIAGGRDREAQPESERLAGRRKNSKNSVTHRALFLLRQAYLATPRRERTTTRPPCSKTTTDLNYDTT